MHNTALYSALPGLRTKSNATVISQIHRPTLLVKGMMPARALKNVWLKQLIKVTDPCYQPKARLLSYNFPDTHGA